jgi:hypothetical protein
MENSGRGKHPELERYPSVADNPCGSDEMKRNLSKEKIKCQCGKWTEPKEFNIDGFKMRGSECSSCGETYFNPEDANQALIYNKIKNEVLTGKVAKSGNSIVVRLPKRLVEALNLTAGETVTISFENPKTVKLVCS